MRISTTGVGLLSISVPLLAISLSGCGGVSDASTYRANGQGRGLGRGHQVVSLQDAGCDERGCGTTGCNSGTAGCGQAKSCGQSKSSNGWGRQTGCQLTSTKGRGCGARWNHGGRGQRPSTCGKSSGCQLTQAICKDGKCSQPNQAGCNSMACGGCSKADATFGTSGQGCGSQGKCGQCQSTDGCERCPESGGACDATESDQVSPSDVSLDAFIGFGPGGGWGRRWWNEESAPPLPQGAHGKGGCGDGKRPSENNKQNDETEQ